MRFEFTKMHALGNDYIIINGFKYPELLKNAKELSFQLSNRHFGIGGDGIIFAVHSDTADLAMRMFNADGSESEMCGNGIRQLASFSFDKGIVDSLNIKIDTLAGVKPIIMEKGADGNIDKIVVDMGLPILEPVQIPAIAEVNKKGFAHKSLKVEGRNFDFTLVSMGNPHAVTFIPSVVDFEVEKYGKAVEAMTDIFPRKTNVEFIEIMSKEEIKMRVWERGSGETLACGTGACASVAAAVLNGHTKRKVLVHLLGGDLEVEWADDGRIYMTGSACKVFEGVAEFRENA